MEIMDTKVAKPLRTMTAASKLLVVVEDIAVNGLYG